MALETNRKREMTMTDLQSKTNEELNVMLAKCLGWKRLTEAEGWGAQICKTHMLKPDEELIASPSKYCSDLNEVARVEAGLKGQAHSSATTELERTYRDNLAKAIGCSWYQSAKLIFASARQRTLALISTLTKTP